MYVRVVMNLSLFSLLPLKKIFALDPDVFRGINMVLSMTGFGCEAQPRMTPSSTLINHFSTLTTPFITQLNVGQTRENGTMSPKSPQIHLSTTNPTTTQSYFKAF